MDEPGAVIVVGASGGIGSALVGALAARSDGRRVYALSRSEVELPPGVTAGRVDVTDEANVAAAIAAVEGSIELVVVASGRLHGEGMAPERTYTALDPQALSRSFQVNAIGPALVAKHALPRFPRTRRAAFAALSARVGSIGDNRLGGWYGYRASKAALNMLVRSLAVELGRTHPLAVCVALHPGTVDTGLSRPFQRNVAPDKLFTPADAAARLLRTLDALQPGDTGGLFAYDGAPIPF